MTAPSPSISARSIARPDTPKLAAVAQQLAFTSVLRPGTLRFEPAQLHRQEEAVMLVDPPVERSRRTSQHSICASASGLSPIAHSTRS